MFASADPIQSVFQLPDYQYFFGSFFNMNILYMALDLNHWSYRNLVWCWLCLGLNQLYYRCLVIRGWQLRLDIQHSQYLSISLTFTHISPLLWSVLQKTNSQADSNFRPPLQKSQLKKTKWWINCLQYLCWSHNCNGWNLALITPWWPWVTYHVWPLCDSINVFNTNPWSDHSYFLDHFSQITDYIEIAARATNNYTIFLFIASHISHLGDIQYIDLTYALLIKIKLLHCHKTRLIHNILQLHEQATQHLLVPVMLFPINIHEVSSRMDPLFEILFSFLLFRIWAIMDW